MVPLGNVSIKANTKEVGLLEFSIETGNKSKKGRPLPASWTAFFRPRLKANIQVGSTSIIGEVSPYLLGQFVEHLERCVYDGIWTKTGSDLREDTVDLIKQLNPPMIRYPGGNFASGYHWEDGIGPHEKRPTRHDAAWQAEESNLVGTDEFLTFCEQIDTVPCLVVNDGSGTPEEAARWVAYCNSPVETTMGELRAANGHPSPYNVKFWGVGNEVWGPWQIGTTSSREYAKRLIRFINAMKSVDPTIKIIAVGNHPLTDEPSDPALLWNKEVLELAGNQIDYLSWHIYQPEKEGWQEVNDDLELFKTICAAPLDVDTYLKRIGKLLAESGFATKVFQALDEWNVWLPPKQGEVSMHRVTYTMRDALYVASTLAVLFRNSESVKIANLAQLVNVLPLIQTNESQAIATSIYYPFILFNQMIGKVIEVKVNSPVFDSKAMGPNITAHQKVDYLDSMVTENLSGDRLSVLLINRHPLNCLDTTIVFNKEANYSPSTCWVLKSNHPLAENTFSNPYRVKLVEKKTPEFSNNQCLVRMEPASIYLLEYRK
jgi:alpha-N-arabinofuranosidase